MNNLTLDALQTWLASKLPNRIFPFARKTPRYRRGPVETVPWISIALVAPLLIFLLWKGATRTRQQAEEPNG